jgi:hypothetical protein
MFEDLLVKISRRAKSSSKSLGQVKDLLVVARRAK